MKAIFIVLSNIVIFYLIGQAQETYEVDQLKAQLLEAKIETLDLKMKMIEKESGQRLHKMDSIITVMQYQKSQVLKKRVNIRDTIQLPEPKSIILIHPERLFEGSLCLSFETRLLKNFFVDLGIMGTYVTRDGLGAAYMKSQNFAYLEASYKDNYNFSYYSGQMITGYGVFLEGKKYLNSFVKAPFGIYAGPQLMYRKVHFIGNVYYNDTGGYKDVVKNLDVVRAGVMLGGKTRIGQVLCLDISVGGVIRLSKYYRDDSPTRYQPWNNIDYSGVLPTLNIKLGILN